MAPKEEEKFTKYDIEGFNIYFHEKIKVSNTVMVNMAEYTSDLPNKEIEVSGIEII